MKSALDTGSLNYTVLCPKCGRKPIHHLETRVGRRKMFTFFHVDETDTVLECRFQVEMIEPTPAKK